MRKPAKKKRALKTRVCNGCGQRKYIKKDFHRCTTSATGRHTLCKTCRKKSAADYRKENPETVKRSKIKQVYDLTDDQVDQVLNITHCELCSEEFCEEKANTRRVVDHCHHHNVYRGVICGGCNWALGYVKDNPDTLQNMIQYLQDHKQTLAQLHND